MANGVVDDDGNVFWSDRDEMCTDTSSSEELQIPVLFGSSSSGIQGCVDQSAGESSPLGLSLKKTPSLINLLQKRLSESPVTNSTAMNEHMSNMQDFMSQSEKLKASNFHANLLKIGGWQRISRHEGDLVAKCYYAKRKLVWEVLDGALKSKIEIQWSDIIGIRVTIKENEPGILEVELNQPPSFHRETDPQPRKHTLWQGASDFTGGQASMCRRHYVEFAPGILDKHLEKLLQCDQRLFMLSQRPFPSQRSPYFDTNAYELSQFSLDFNGYRQSQIYHGLQYPNCQNLPPLSGVPIRYETLRSNAGPPLRIADSFQPTPGYQTNELMAVAGSNFVMENQNNALWSGADQIAEHAIDIAMPSLITSVSQTTLDFLTQNFNVTTATAHGDGGIGEISSTTNGLLSHMENHVLGDTQEIYSMESASLMDSLMFVGDGIVDDQVTVNIEENYMQVGGQEWSQPMNWLPHTELYGNVMQEGPRDHCPYGLPN